MISLTLRFDETVFPRIEGQEAGRFLLAMIQEQPQLAVQGAVEIEVKGDFGRVTERL